MWYLPTHWKGMRWTKELNAEQKKSIILMMTHQKSHPFHVTVNRGFRKVYQSVIVSAHSHYLKMVYTEWMNVFFKVLGTEICHHNVCCALTNLEPVTGLFMHNLCKNTIMVYGHVQKWECGIMHRMIKEGRKRWRRKE